MAFEPYSEEEYKKADPEFQAKAPWVDKNDLVHLPPGTSIAGHTMLSFLEYRAIKKWLMKGTLYERFLPLETHIPWYDPAYIY